MSLVSFSPRQSRLLTFAVSAFIVFCLLIALLALSGNWPHLDGSWAAGTSPSRMTIPTFTPVPTESAVPTPSPTPTEPGDSGGGDDVPSAPLPDPAPRLPLWPAVELYVSTDQATARSGERINLSIRVDIIEDLSEAVLESVLPVGLELEPETTAGAEYVSASRQVRWQLSKLQKGQQVEFRLSLRVTDLASDLMTQRVTFSAPGYAGPKVAQVTLKRTFPPTETNITAERGGELVSADGRVRVIVPSDAVSVASRVQHIPLEVRKLDPPKGGMALKFELNAFADQDSSAITTFSRPLEVRVNVAGLVDRAAMASHQYLVLSYLDEEEGEWVELPTIRHGETLVTQLDHFTIVGASVAGATEGGWGLVFNDAHVDGFSGGFSYSYPLDVPAGRGGLTPDLSLNYSSRRVDGILSWIQADWTGLGWSLDTMEIVRWVQPVKDWTQGYVDWMNKFTLIYKGTAYKLTPGDTEPSFEGLTDPYGRYFTEDEQFLYIERRNAAAGNGSSVNETSEYWIVRTRDGTQYRLGYTTTSEFVATTKYYGDVGDCFWSSGSPPTPPNTRKCYAGEAREKVAFRWRADLIADTRGNEIVLEYEEEPRLDLNCDKASYLREVKYNRLSDDTWGTRITFERADRSDLGDTRQATEALFYQDEYLTSIAVENWNGSSYELVREYDLSYDKPHVQQGHDNKTRQLSEIEVYDSDGISGTTALPATALEYTVYHNKGWKCIETCTECIGTCTDWDKSVFTYTRLTTISNGYGGVISAHYESPDANDYNYQLAWNYRVTHVYREDGRTGDESADSRIEYDYPSDVNDRCYDNNGTYGCDWAFSPPPLSYTGGSLIGYSSVTETLKNEDGEIVSIVHRDFITNSESVPLRSLGREWRVRFNDPSEVVLRQVETDWVVETLTHTFGITPCNSYFVYAYLVSEKLRTVDGLPASPQKKTYSQYITSIGEELFQSCSAGEAQFGNLTRLVEVGLDVSASEYITRETLIRYYANAVTNTETIDAYTPEASRMWIVNRPARKTIRDGDENALTKFKYIYDDVANDYDDPPVRGDLVVVSQTEALSPAHIWVTLQTVVYDPDTYYLPTAVNDANGNEKTTEYDSVWEMYSITVTNALGQKAVSEYDYVKGLLTKVTDPNGAVTSYGYDDFGRLTKLIRPRDNITYPTTVFEYYDTYSPFKIVTRERINGGEAETVSTIRFYDGLGRQLQEKSTVGSNTSKMLVTWVTYNAQGLQEHVSVPLDRAANESYITRDLNLGKTTYDYDALGRVITAMLPGELVTTCTSYNYNGTKKAVVDQSGYQITYESDAFGRLTRVKEYKGVVQDRLAPQWGETDLYATTVYTYSELDLLVELEDGKGRPTTIEYDVLGRKTSYDDQNIANNRKWYYKYDNVGNLLTQVDARKNATCMYYDELNRLEGKNYVSNVASPSTYTCPSSTASYTVTYTYDAFDPTNGQYGRGHRTGMTDESGSTAWKYDERGRVISTTKTIDGAGGGTFTTLWTYNSRDQVATQRYPDGEVVTTTYDTRAQPQTLVGNSNYVVDTTWRYDGRILGIERGGTANSPILQTGYTYFAWSNRPGMGALNTITSGTSGDPDALQDLDYRYNTRHDISRIYDYTRGGEQVQFYYGPTKRLYSFNVFELQGGNYVNVYKEQRIYDLTGNNGNWTLYENGTGLGATQWVAFTGQNAPPVGNVTGAIVTGSRIYTHTYGYDANGNMTLRELYKGEPANHVTYTLSYDEENRLEGVSGGASATFVYDGDGNRVKGTVGGVTTIYIGNYYERTGDDVTKHYYHAGQLVAMRVDGTLYWLLTNYQGSVTVVADANGAAVATTVYDPWGDVYASSGTISTTLRYTGQREEPGIGLYDYKARWYDPWLGRFIQPDPIVPDPTNPQALNRYSYCLNDPVNHTDPSGYDPLDAQWRKDFKSVHGRDPGALDEAIRLFSLAYMDVWFSQNLDSKFYNANHTVNEEFLSTCFHTPPASRSWDTMASALASLARFYNEDEEAAFVRDVAFLYAGMAGRSQNTGLRPYWAVGGFSGNVHLYIQGGTIDRSLIETTVNGASDPDANVHHWAWAFAAGYHIRAGAASGINAVREYNQGSGKLWNRSVDQSDVKIGSLGARMGSALRTSQTGYAQIPALFQDYLGVGGIQ